MDKEKYIKEGFLNVSQSSFEALVPFGAVFLMLLSILDYYVTPENFGTFFIYRLITSSSVLALYFSVKLKKTLFRDHQLFYTLMVTLVSAFMVEAMVLSLGGHQSSYYAGMIVVITFILGFLVIPFEMTVLAGISIYAVYLIPILLFDEITNIRIFINNNAFLLASALGAFGWRYYNQKLLINNLSLQYDLEQQKKELEVYSRQLQGMVEDRTKELKKSEEWHKSLFENATDGVIVFDNKGMIVNANAKACEIHGFTKEELIGASHAFLETDENIDKAAAMMQRLMAGESAVYESMHRKKDGSRIWVEISSKAIPMEGELLIQSFQRDITEKKRTQEHLLQSQKLESIGVLAGGIAHDFNNILTAILGHSELVRQDSKMGEKAARSLNIIEDISRKAGQMVSKLLGFARKSTYEIISLNLNDVIYDTIKLLERVIDKRINLTIELDNSIPLIHGDLNQMEQIIMNLIVNARDAMPEGGRIAVKTRIMEVTKDMPDMPPFIIPGEYVVITISDTGMGIPEEIQNKIFEPFFTTKERGKGTGLGLSMVYGAVKEHKGYITLKSKMKEGSTFTVYIPAGRAVAPVQEKQPVIDIEGTETVMIIDDEETVLTVMRESLERHGYKVLATTDPLKALDMFRKISGEISLVITDIVMPKMDGKELIKQIKLINGETKILAVSGYTKHVAEKQDITGKDGFLQKPFESVYLLTTVRQILDANGMNVTAGPRSTVH